MTAGLTRQQSACLSYIQAFQDECGYAPTYDQIAAAVGLASKGGVNRLIVGLEERGRIRRLPNRARSIEIIDRRDADFHLIRILDAVSCSGFIRSTDPIIAAAREAVGRVG